MHGRHGERRFPLGCAVLAGGKKRCERRDARSDKQGPGADVGKQHQAECRSQCHRDRAAKAEVTDALTAARGRDDVSDQRCGEGRAESEAEAVDDSGDDDGTDGIQQCVSRRCQQGEEKTGIETGLLAEGTHAGVGEQADEDGGIPKDAGNQADL